MIILASLLREVPNPLDSQICWTSRLQPTSISLAKGGSTLQRYDYKYGQVNQATGVVDETKNNGQIARIEGYIGATRQWQQRFSYDSLGRLATAGEYRGDTLALTYQSTFSYDRFGNRYQKQALNSQSLSYIPVEDADTNPATNRLTSNTTYDDAGNVTIDNKFRGMQYKYDANGRMWRSANADGTAEATSVYDGLGQRVQTIDSNNTKTLVYDVFGRMIAEYDTEAQAVAGVTRYLMTDVQGSTRVVTDNNGSVIARHDYQAFGGEIGAGVGLRTTSQKYDVSDSTRQRYAQTERDAIGLDHTWWRKYDNSAGRLTTPDPYNGSMMIADPQSFNRYSYVENDLVNLVDPSGLWQICFIDYTYVHYSRTEEDGTEVEGTTINAHVTCFDFAPFLRRDDISEPLRHKPGPPPPSREEEIANKMGMTLYHYQQQEGFDACAKKALRSYRKTYVGTSLEAMLGGAFIGSGASFLMRGIPGTAGALSLRSAGEAISHAPANQNAIVTAIIASHEAATSAQVAGAVLGPGGYLAADSMSRANKNVANLNAAIEDCKRKFPGAPYPFLNSRVVFSL